MTACRNTCRLLALVGVGVLGLLTLVGSGGGGGDEGGSPPKAWGTAELIETENFFGAVRPQIAVDGSGNAIAVWQQHDGTRENIWANRFE